MRATLCSLDIYLHLCSNMTFSLLVAIIDTLVVSGQVTA